MKSLFVSFILSLLIASTSYGQHQDATKNFVEQVEKMGEAFLKSDYQTYTSYTYPLILKSMGGTSKMTEVLNGIKENMKSQGMMFTNITYDKPTKIMKSGQELQATIAQHSEIKAPQGRIIITSTLIGISTDNGIKWTFIDTSDKDMATLRKVLPNLSPEITVPRQQPPVRYSN